MGKRDGFVLEAPAIVKRALDKIVSDGIVPGCGIMVGYKGERAFEAYSGYADEKKRLPSSSRVYYRMYSMTKVLTVACIMQLWDRGLLRLNDEVSKFIPEFKNMTVWDGEKEVPANREITIYDLLTMTSGIAYESDGYVGQVFNRTVKEWLSDREKGEEWDTLKVARKIAAIPLLFQPGEQFLYGLSHDVLGAVIEVITGKNLCEYMTENLFIPLGMKEASFEINDKNRDFMAEVSGQIVPKDEAGGMLGCLSFEKPKFFSGGAGLICTLEDYFRFTRMLALGGTVDGKRILSRKAIEMLSTPQLNERQSATFHSADDSPLNIYRGYSYGLGVRVCVKPNISPDANSRGEYGWAGMLGTWMFVDPEEDIFMVYVHQHFPTEHERYMPQVTNAVYAALK